MSIALLLGVFAGALQFAGYIAYNVSMVRRGVRPNTASWFIWSFGSVASSWSYVVMSDGSAEDILPIVCAISCILTFCHILKRGERKSIDKNEWLIIGLDVIIVVYWLTSEILVQSGEAAVTANLLFQISTILSFVPIVKEVWHDRTVESKAPWVIWSMAYATELSVVWVQGSRWEEWIYPAVCLPLHFIVAIIAKTRHEQ